MFLPPPYKSNGAEFRPGYWIDSAAEWGKDYHVYILAESVNSSKTPDYASVPVELDKPHVHDFTYAVNGGAIEATCRNSDGKCPLEDHKTKVEVTAPTDLTYNGENKTAPVTTDGPLNIPSVCYMEGNTPIDHYPVNAGSYTASITLEGKTASVSYTISKKPVTISGLSVEDKVYDGKTDAVVKGTFSLSGILEADKESVELVSGNAVFEDPNAGANKKVILSGWKFTGDKAINYELQQPADMTADIDKADQSDIEVWGKARYGTEGVVELKDSILPGGTPSDVGIWTDPDGVLNGLPSLDGTRLKFAFKDDPNNVDKVAVVAISVKDATNYSPYEIRAKLQVTDCMHVHKTLIEGTSKTANCTEKGYTGDFECSDCHARIKGEDIPINPDNHNFEKVGVVKPATAITKGETKYKCSRCGAEKIVADIPCIDADDGKDYEDLRKDIEDLSGDAAPVVEKSKDENGNDTEIVKIGGEEVSKTVKDPESGKETIVSKVWIAGLEKTYTYTGSAIKPAVHVYDGTRKLIENTDYSLSYSNNKEVGKNAAIIVKFKGSYSSSESTKAGFEIVKAELGKDIIAHDTGTTDEKKLKKAVPSLTWTETGQTVSRKYFNFDYSDVTGNESIVTITPKENYSSSYTGKITAKVKIVKDNSLLISKAKVVFTPKTYSFTGKEITPSYKVTIGNDTLVKDTDFCETIQNCINPGTAKVLIEAKPGNAKGYVGSKTVSFKITGNRKLEDAEPFSYEVSKSAPFAKGGAKAAVVVKDGTTTLKEGRDYTLSYSKNRTVTNGETAEVKIKGKGNYKGTVLKKFAITKQDLSALEGNIIIADQFAAKDKLKAPSITITDLDGKKLSSKKDFSVEKIDPDDPANTEESGTVKVTIKAKDGGAYTGTVIASFRYMKPEANIGKAKVVKKIEDQTYTGYAVKLSNEDLKGVLSIGSKTLEPGKDFVIDKGSYQKNNGKGTAKVTVVGTGAFAGRKTITFRIVERKVDFKGNL